MLHFFANSEATHTNTHFFKLWSRTIQNDLKRSSKYKKCKNINYFFRKIHQILSFFFQWFFGALFYLLLFWFVLLMFPIPHLFPALLLIWLSTYFLTTTLPTYLSTSLPNNHLSTCLSTFLCVNIPISINLPVYLFTWLSICISNYLPAHISTYSFIYQLTCKQ